MTDETTTDPTEVEQQQGGEATGSLQERAARRRAELQAEHRFVLPIPGYEDMFAARYLAQDYKPMRAIARRHEDMEDAEEAEVLTAADTLINTCVELLEVKAPGSYQSLGVRWDSRAASLFGLDPAPEFARDVIRGVLPDTLLMMHYRQFGVKLDEVLLGVREQLEGESEAA